MTTRLRQSQRTAWLIATALVVGGCTQARMEPSAETKTADSSASAATAQQPPLNKRTDLPPQLRPGHPQRYTVQSGDTLWSISERYLKDPWRWREIWRQNPSVQNPNRIYPGDVIEVFQENGQPRLRLASVAPGQHGTIKLTPQMRVEQISQPIPTVPRDSIAQFLKHSEIMTAADWKKAPYLLVGPDERLIYQFTDRLYARGAVFDDPVYQIYRVGQEYKVEVDGDEQSLGYNMEYVGEARVDQDGDPAQLTMLSSVQEAKPGDRLFPLENEDVPYEYELRPAAPDTEGKIIDVLSGEFLIGRYQTVVLDLGEADVEAGQVLKVMNKGVSAKDPLTGESVRLPDERAGLLMVYKVFNRTSYALVMEATRAIRISDRVADPGA